MLLANQCLIIKLTNQFNSTLKMRKAKLKQMLEGGPAVARKTTHGLALAAVRHIY